MEPRQNGLPHDNPVAITCDEAYDIVYIGFEEDDGSIARYDYVNLRFLAELDEDDNTVSEPVFPGAMYHYGAGLLVGHYDGGGITQIATTGPAVTRIIPFSQGDEATSIVPVPGAKPTSLLLVVQVDPVDTTAWTTLIQTDFPGRLGQSRHHVNRQDCEFTGNSTHIWAAPIDDYFSHTVLQFLKESTKPMVALNGAEHGISMLNWSMK